eukprot:10853293-Alexandrium_andersonii.AAC.1
MLVDVPSALCGGCGMPLAREPPERVGTVVQGVAGDGLGAEYAAPVGGPEERAGGWLQRQTPPATPRARLRRKTAPSDQPPASAPR